MFFTSSKDNLSLKARNLSRSASVRVSFSDECLKEAQVCGSNFTKGEAISSFIMIIEPK